jgi:hypothetical protein
MTDTAKAAQGKVLVSLPRDTADDIDTLGMSIADALEKQAGIRVELSRAQIVQAITKQAVTLMDAAYDAAETNSTLDGADSEGVT